MKAYKRAKGMHWFHAMISWFPSFSFYECCCFIYLFIYLTLRFQLTTFLFSKLQILIQYIINSFLQNKKHIPQSVFYFAFWIYWRD
jgi:hypothetical protein